MDKQAFLDLIEADRSEHIALLQKFIQAPSPNPPGDTADAATVLSDYLAQQGVPVEVIAPQGPSKPNLVSDFLCGSGSTTSTRSNGASQQGRRIVMNGHIDVFPVDTSQSDKWSHGGPWSGHNDGTHIYGRGGVDMKAGTLASTIAYSYLYRRRDRLGKQGSVALTLVSDEETGGKFGSRWLLEHDPDRWSGDVMINAEPGGLQSIRFGEKGTLRITFTVITKGVHGAYTHLSEGANRVASRLVQKLLQIETDITPDLDPSIVEHMRSPEVRKVVDEIMGPGAADIVLKPTVNIGTMHGGIKVNMIPDRCVVEADIRLPIGLTKDVVLKYIDDKVLDGFPQGQVSYQVQKAASNPPSHCPVDHDMVGVLAGAAEKVTGRKPLAIPSLGATDTKFWRYRGVPAYVFGVSPETMAAGVDERVSIDEFLAVVKTHALAVWEYLGGK
ncbi:acetylornithine deacetylase/succinyldiaminopimelate desuccinylase-like deacylase [Exophiala viscosa]|uniref:acetylornithine deacetylase/succinyldiaminopimelate desuccinylase-like deacylase n=1 Tax=Exophiala viscosa TaxID=2486360 RepID=UPI00218D6A05|nr:acetylornithine deacetylase/succinyldiaminopimelate desuccinylase-like deacylase [Exophiala viscosa]